MYEYSDEEKILFDTVENKISTNGKKLIYSLNDNWKLLGVDDITRQKRTEELIKIVQERYDEVLEETLDKIRRIKSEIENLKKESHVLGERLSIKIVTSPIKNGTPLHIIRESLENDLERYRKLIASREEKLLKLYEWQKKLCHMLGCPLRELSECPLPTEEALENFSNYLNAQEKEYETRVNFFVKKQEQIKNLLNELEEEPQDSFQYYVVKSTNVEFRVTDQNMAKLDAVYKTLSSQLEQKQIKVLEMRERLTVLWERLEESPAYRANFLSIHPGHSRATQSALDAELQRCEEKKRQSFKLFVGKVRAEIVEIWDKCLYSDIQREKFVEFYSNIYNEDLLMLHEIYLDELKAFFKENKDIFDMYSTRQQLWIKWSELEARANEPGRFHNRGGQLLKEEKERRGVSNQLPKIEAELTQLVELYESRTGKTFTVNGESLLLIMQKDWNQKNMEKKNKLSARKQAPSITMSAPRSAPPPRQINNYSTRGTATAIKRRLSPRQSPQVGKSRLFPRRLHLSPSSPAPLAANGEPSQAKKFKGPVPKIAVNGYLLKKKVVGRRSNDKKNKRRSRRSQSSGTSERDQEMPENTLSSYVDFQEHLNDNIASRSSIVPGRVLRSRIFNPQASSSIYLPDGQITPSKNTFSAVTSHQKEECENISPRVVLTKMTPNRALYATNTFGATPNRCKKNILDNVKTPDGRHLKNMDVFATPRPVSKAVKSGLLYRQNTVTLASPSPIDKTRTMLRSSSSHNLRGNVSPSYPLQSSKLQLASKLPLII